MISTLQQAIHTRQSVRVVLRTPVYGATSGLFRPTHFQHDVYDYVAGQIDLLVSGWWGHDEQRVAFPVAFIESCEVLSEASTTGQDEATLELTSDATASSPQSAWDGDLPFRAGQVVELTAPLNIDVWLRWRMIEFVIPAHVPVLIRHVDDQSDPRRVFLVYDTLEADRDQLMPSEYVVPITAQFISMVDTDP